MFNQSNKASIPSEMGRMANLQTLDVSINQLFTLPTTFSDLTSLNTVSDCLV